MYAADGQAVPGPGSGPSGGAGFGSAGFVNVAEALRAGAVFADFLNSPAAAEELSGPACGEVLAALGQIQDKLSAEAKRFHDALQLACELLLRAKLVPDRAGADTQVIAHIPLSQLRKLPGAADLEDAWIRARLGEDGYLTGKDAEAAACDAQTVPVVTGIMDPAVIDQMIDLARTAAEVTTAADPAGPPPGDPADAADQTAQGPGGQGREPAGDPRSAALSPEAWRALRSPDGRQVLYSHAPPTQHAADPPACRRLKRALVGHAFGRGLPSRRLRSRERRMPARLLPRGQPRRPSAAAPCG